MKPAVHFRDPQSVTKLRIDALLEAALLLPDPPPFLEGFTAATRLPRKPADPQPDRLLVARSGPWLSYSVATATNRVRVVAWALDDDVAWDASSWIHARLLALPGDEDLVSYQYDSGPARAVDPDYDSPITAFTIRARMRVAIL